MEKQTIAEEEITKEALKSVYAKLMNEATHEENESLKLRESAKKKRQQAITIQRLYNSLYVKEESQ